MIWILINTSMVIILRKQERTKSLRMLKNVQFGRQILTLTLVAYINHNSYFNSCSLHVFQEKSGAIRVALKHNDSLGTFLYAIQIAWSMLKILLTDCLVNAENTWTLALRTDLTPLGLYVRAAVRTFSVLRQLTIVLSQSKCTFLGWPLQDGKCHVLLSNLCKSIFAKRKVLTMYFFEEIYPLSKRFTYKNHPF